MYFSRIVYCKRFFRMNYVVDVQMMSSHQTKNIILQAEIITIHVRRIFLTVSKVCPFMATRQVFK